MLPAFLDITKSLSNRKWLGPSDEQERRASALIQSFGISHLTGLLLSKRNIHDDEVKSFLNPKLRNLMPDPHTLKDVQKAVDRMLEAINSREKICIYADYDVDGTVSASMLYLWFKNFQITPEIYIPDRIKEGYGPNVPAMKAVSDRNTLIICVDCGTVSHDAISAAVTNGADVIVVDHHLSDDTLPPAFAIINPNRKDEDGELNYLCAAGVVFFLLVAANRSLRNNKIEPPDIVNLLDLVALATVADVVPLIKLNRAFVTQGLKLLALRNRPGLVAIGDAAGINTKPTSFHLGYLIAPRINAAGRLDDAKFAVKLLTGEENSESNSIANELNQLNDRRKLLESTALNEAVAQIENKPKNDVLIWVASKNWHPGVIGIVAARLKDQFRLPAIVFSINKDGIAVGSARSISGTDIGENIKKLLKKGYLIAGGGHKMAAGLKLNDTLLPVAMALLETELSKTSEHISEIGNLEIDSLISTKGATLELVEEISTVGPFGAGNPSPRVAIANCKIKYIKVLTEKHIKFTCSDSTGQKLEAIFFNGVQTPAGQRLMSKLGETFHICGKLEINDWGGYRRVVLQVDDISIPKII